MGCKMLANQANPAEWASEASAFGEFGKFEKRLLFEVSTADWRIGEFAESQSLGPRPPRLLAMCYAGVSYSGRVTCARGHEERDFATWGAVVVPCKGSTKHGGEANGSVRLAGGGVWRGV